MKVKYTVESGGSVTRAEQGSAPKVFAKTSRRGTPWVTVVVMTVALLFSVYLNHIMPENVFLERLPEIAKNAIADACTGSNPRQPSQEEMEKLLKCCYYDTEVDF